MPPVAMGLALMLVPTSALPEPRAERQTPAQQRLVAAQQQVASRPRDPEGHRELAVALTRRARETADAAYYERALGALARARKALPEGGVGSLELDAVEAWVRLGRHEFDRAEALARRGLAGKPDDPSLYGLLGDARMELGRYREAAAAYERMLELRPGPNAFVRAAYYREVTGDLEGALELLGAALAATPAREVEERAWMLVQVAGIEVARGRLEAADAVYRDALASFPAYPCALEGRARLALRAGEARRAETLARAALGAGLHPERRLLLADALLALDRPAEAREQERHFEREALEGLELADNENLFLVDFYLDRRRDPPRALELAMREAQRRADLGTLTRLARALHANGKRTEGLALMERVLATGTRDPEILGRARELGARPRG